MTDPARIAPFDTNRQSTKAKSPPTVTNALTPHVNGEHHLAAISPTTAQPRADTITMPLSYTFIRRPACL